MDFDTRFEKYQAEIAEAMANIGKYEESIDEKQADLKGSNEDPAPAKARAEAARALIDKRSLEEMNKILTTSSPKALVEGMEALVGILRNVNQATNIDVELFLKDPSKLLTKFKRMESHGLTYSHVEKHKKELEGVIDTFKQDNRNPGKDENGKQQYNLFPFLPIMEWGLEFATAAAIELKKDDLERSIKTLQQQLADAKLLIERTEQIITDIEEVKMSEYYDNQPHTLAERKHTVDVIHIEDQRQSLSYQKELHHFEKTYFEKLRAAVKEAAQ